MTVERDIQALIDAAGKDLTVPRVHDVLLTIADTVGARPQRVTGPGLTFTWRLGDQGLAVGVSRYGGSMRLYADGFDWAEREDEEWRSFTWEDSVAYLPYLWSLPVDGRAEWEPGSTVTRSWEEFFHCFGAAMDKLPSELALVPPAWRTRQPAVTSMWNLVSEQLVTIAVSLSPEGADLSCMRLDQSMFDLHVPAARLDSGEVSLPAVLAGLTATGALQELEYFDTEIAPGGVYPSGVRRDDEWIHPEDLTPGRPPATQSLDEVTALLA